MTQAEIAERVGVTIPAIGKWLSKGTIAMDSLIKLAQVTKVNFEWLATGGGPSKVEQPEIHCVSLVPLLNWTQVGVQGISLNTHNTDEMLPCPVSIGPRGFVLRIQNEAMLNPIAPSFRSYPPGAYIFIDPDRPVTNGARVIAALDGIQEAVFRTYNIEAEQQFLTAINPHFPTININQNVQICGVVVCKVEVEGE